MDNSEFQKRLIPTAYGIHDRIDRALRELFEAECGHTCFSFYEYVLETPVTIYDDYAARDDLRHQRVAAPYLRRFAHQHEMMPAVKSNDPLSSLVAGRSRVEMVPYTPRNISEYWDSFDCAMLDLADTHILGSLLRSWQTKTTQFRYICPTKRPVALRSLDGIAEFTCFFRSSSLARLPWLLRQSLLAAASSGQGEHSMTAKNELAALSLREYALTVMPFLRTKPDRDVCVCAYSLSSGAVFWGQALVIFPVEQEMIPRSGQLPDKVEEFIHKLCSLAVREIHDVYVPVLTMLKNTLEEAALKDLYDKKPKDSLIDVGAPDPLKPLCDAAASSESNLMLLGSGKWNMVQRSAAVQAECGLEWLFGRLVSKCLTAETNLSHLGSIEKRLVELWADRLWRLRYPAEARNILGSLLFEKYLVASPELMARVTQAINLNHRLSDAKTSVTSALVVGGPGSGKDTLAKLIWLFSPGFRFGGQHTFNMAMFRPKDAAVPLLLGLDLQCGHSAPAPLQLSGLLLRALSANAAGSRDAQVNRGFCFIFDELNSLDIDTQGALLRFLENAELTPLGGLHNPLDTKTEEGAPVQKHILVIGVMNEDPHLIMKRQAMDRILKESQLFGTIVGQTLHEMFRNQRRLRDDLYYRLIRGGEIVLPSLRERVEDIPSLFYDYIAKSRSMYPEHVTQFEVNLSVYDALMDRTLNWEGNLRELQTVSRNILLAAKADHEERGLGGSAMVIRGVHARRALERLRDPRASIDSSS